MKTTLLHPSCYYHIYNHANGSDNIFRDRENYYYFLKKWREYTEAFIETISFCLMPNHFHFLIWIKDSSAPNLQGLDLGGLDDHGRFLSKQLSNFFNCYTKSINKRYRRYGSLFAPNFKRKLVDSYSYLKVASAYIHLNPVFHGFTTYPEEWEFSSIHQFNPEVSSWVKRELVLVHFNSFNDYLNYHEEILQTRKLNSDLQ